MTLFNLDLSLASTSYVKYNHHEIEVLIIKPCNN